MTDTPVAKANTGYNKNFKKKKKPKRLDNYTPSGDPALLSKPIEELGLKEKTLDILKAGNVVTVADLIKYRERELYRIQNFNKKNLIDVTENIAKLKLSFRPEEAKTNNEIRPNIVATAPAPASQPDTRDRIKVLSNGRIDDRIRVGDNRNRPNNNQFRQNRNENQPRNNNNNNNSNNNTGNNNNRNKQYEDNLSSIGKKPPFVYTELKEEKLPPDALIKFSKDNKYGFKDMKGRVVIPAIYDEVFNFKEGLACVEQNGLYGYIDKQNNMVIPCEFELAMSFSEGLACVTMKEKSGYIDKTGNIVIDIKYEKATSFEEDYARVKVDGKWATLTKEGLLRIL